MKELHLAFLIYATQMAPKTQLDEVLAETLGVLMENEEDFVHAVKLTKILALDLQILAKAAVKAFGEKALEFKEVIEKEFKQGEQWERYVKRFSSKAR
ncbi:hypothetical protein EYM_04940 [Ignicoccus islandicus DSM 13165]|uniref:Uncharacterized protein n=1 Tax=Ignicoccus islandicus DSM 13165 TaxID=940295 RepID=A0A0U3FL30_9CREN|nr:hypothetical protein [Ignicoccus islandicus]ALU12534.1 hypothetical protein EYM_04940 [Ignicoccus islandicus DSM 13165]